MLASSSRRGLADRDPAELGAQVLAAWDAFLDVVTAPSTDLSRPSRLPGWTGRDTCVHLGAWPDNQPLQGLVASARAGAAGGTPVPDEENARLLRAHAGASDDEVVQALVEARDRIEGFVEGPEARELGRLPARSSLGALPLLSLVHAATYELAVHALDLAPCGAPRPATVLLDRGLAALMDVTGALAARSGVALTVTAQTTDGGGWAFTSGPEGWEVSRAAGLPGPSVRGTAEDLLDASAGRTGLAPLLLSRRLVVHDLPGFMRLAPLVHEVPGLPGGAALRSAVGGLSRVTGVLGRLRR